jgi:hypothetical protein
MSRWILRGTPGTSDSLAGPQPTDEGVCDGQEQPGGVHRRRHGALRKETPMESKKTTGTARPCRRRTLSSSSSSS